MMRTHDEQTPHASRSFGVRQFKARATSSAKRFLPMPSSPVNSSAPGSRSVTSIRFSAALTREFPVSSSNILHGQMASALEIGDDDFSHVLLSSFHWSTRVNQLHALGFPERDLQVSITDASVKVGVLDIQAIE